MDAVVAQCDGGVVGRPHVARALVESGHVADFQEAFDRFLGNGKPADVPKMMVGPEFTIDLIHQAGGIAVLAHPGLWNQFDLIRELVPMGLDGVEVWHTKHSPEEVARLAAIAKEFGLVMSGGSDCHGRLGDRPELLGSCGLDRSGWEVFRARLRA
ncbi:hypothetical protein HZA57_07365 [Candidatus Poribacteria bacterium]|nr:hypothetical protein [Candidatus Poribacteria bacterium]